MRINLVFKRVILLCLIPLLVSGIGALCNIIVMEANGGMPVKEYSYSSISRYVYEKTGGVLSNAHIIYDNNTRFKFLADIFHINGEVYSIGDFLMFIGFALWFAVIGLAVFQYLKDKKRGVIPLKRLPLT